MSTSEYYSGRDGKSCEQYFALISYLKERGNKSSYYGFLNLHLNIIITTSTFSDNWKDLNNTWISRFLKEVKRLNLNQEIFKEKINSELLRYAKEVQTFWQEIIKEKENLVSSTAIVISHPKKSVEISAEELTSAKTLQQDVYKKTQKNTIPKQKREGSQQNFREKTQKNAGKTTQKRELKRARDDDTDTENSSNEHWKRQSQILEQNKNNLVYRQVVDNAILIASAYESLIAGDIIPFIKILKNFLLLRSQMSLSSANEPVLQAIVENLLPSKYCVPEFSLVMNGKKPKGLGRFGYSDIFILSNTDSNVCLELKYISLVGLNESQKNNLGANELEYLDKTLEKENEESVLIRSYSYWSKEDKKTKLTTVGEILDNGMNQLNSYMKTISKGRVMNYSNPGVFDKRVKIAKSKPNNKLKGFVILVIGFRRILWRSADEIKTNYIYNKI